MASSRNGECTCSTGMDITFDEHTNSDAFKDWSANIGDDLAEHIKTESCWGSENTTARSMESDAAASSRVAFEGLEMTVEEEPKNRTLDNVDDHELRVKFEPVSSPQNTMLVYHLVEFLSSERRETAVIPDNWLQEGRETCLWPEKCQSSWVMEGRAPDPAWTNHSIRILHSCSDFRCIKQIEEKALIQGDVSVTSGAGRKRRRISQNGWNRTGERSSDSESDTSSGSSPTRKRTRGCAMPSSSHPVGGTGHAPSLSSEQLIERILHSVEELKSEMRATSQKLDRIIVKYFGKDDAVPALPEECDFPLTTPDELESLNNLLTDNTKRLNLVRYLGSLGGRDLRDCMRNILGKIFNTNLARQYNYHGKRGKLKLSSLDLVVTSVFEGARQQHPQATEDEMIRIMAKWLTGSRDRDHGRAERAEINDLSWQTHSSSKDETEEETSVCKLFISSQVFHHWQDIATHWSLRTDTDVAWFLIQRFEEKASHEKLTSYCGVCHGRLTLCCRNCDSLHPKSMLSGNHGNQAAPGVPWVVTLTNDESPQDANGSDDRASRKSSDKIAGFDISHPFETFTEPSSSFQSSTSGRTSVSKIVQFADTSLSQRTPQPAVSIQNVCENVSPGCAITRKPHFQDSDVLVTPRMPVKDGKVITPGALPDQATYPSQLTTCGQGTFSDEPSHQAPVPSQPTPVALMATSRDSSTCSVIPVPNPTAGPVPVSVRPALSVDPSSSAPLGVSVQIRPSGPVPLTVWPVCNRPSSSELVPIHSDATNPTQQSSSDASSDPGLLSTCRPSPVQMFPSKATTTATPSGLVSLNARSAENGDSAATQPVTHACISSHLPVGGSPSAQTSSTCTPVSLKSAKSSASVPSSSPTTDSTKRTAKGPKTSVTAVSQRKSLPIKPATKDTMRASSLDSATNVGSLPSVVPVQTSVNSQTGVSTKLSLTCQSQPVILLVPGQMTTAETSAPSTNEKSPQNSKTKVKNHTCSRCGATFKRRYQCVRHMQRHLIDKRKGENPWKCTQCSAKYKFAKALKKHMRTHTHPEERKRASCDICAKSFTCRSYLKTHMLVHSDEKPFVCDECGKSYKTQAALNGHRELHSGKPCICHICGASFPREYYLRRHIARHKGEKRYICQTCGAKFTALNSLKVHMRYHTGERPYVCKLCDAGFAQSTDLNKHVKRMHGENKPYSCKFCGLSYALNSDLNKHLAYHARSDSSFSHIPFETSADDGFDTAMPKELIAATQKRSDLIKQARSCPVKKTSRLETGTKQFFCEKCGMSFTLARSLRIHVRAHTGDKPHVCTECGTSFVTSGRLKEHMRSHTGEKPYMCDQCGSAFTSSSSLRHHQQRHTGERPYVCDDCGKAFKLEKDLQRHVKTHDQTGKNSSAADDQKVPKAFVCDECGKSFVHASSLKKHQRVHFRNVIDVLPDKLAVQNYVHV